MLNIRWIRLQQETQPGKHQAPKQGRDYDDQRKPLPGLVEQSESKVTLPVPSGFACHHRTSATVTSTSTGTSDRFGYCAPISSCWSNLSATLPVKLAFCYAAVFATIVQNGVAARLAITIQR
jgi:hypothetical protein